MFSAIYLRNGTSLAPDGTRWHQMAPDGTKWHQMAPDGTKILLRYSVSVFAANHRLRAFLRIRNAYCEFFLRTLYYYCVGNEFQKVLISGFLKSFAKEQIDAKMHEQFERRDESLEK